VRPLVRQGRNGFEVMNKAITIIMIGLAALVSMAAHAAPDGYSINSDSASGDADSLYRIDLSTGVQTKRGKVQSLGQNRIDVEGLAFSPDGTLYGVDDDSMKLFPINTDNGAVIDSQEVSITGMGPAGGNDFGLTFACDGSLYATSVSQKSLYRLNLDGTTSLVGNMGQNISALAAYGNPVQLYGLSNGLLANGNPDTRSLYRINTSTGAATLVGGALGGAAGSYHEAGLAFDNDGQLWAITDRRAVPGGPFGSQILSIDKITGTATLKSTTSETGFESLAVTVPRGCEVGNGQTAQFTVQKRFVDSNNITPVTLNLSCNTGLPLNQSITVQPNDGLFNQYEVNFIVESFNDGQMSCTVTESAVNGYTPTYTCLGESPCGEAQSSSSCVFNGVTIGSENLCQVQNYPNPVNFTVIKEWLFAAEELGESDISDIELECANVFGGDGQSKGNSMYWNWAIDGNSSLTAVVYPDFAGTTACRASESSVFSGVEANNGCADWIPVLVGDSAKSCTIINTVFLEGIPTLSDLGKLLFALLMLGSGVIAIRRT
jgi:hypothetical protein